MDMHVLPAEEGGEDILQQALEKTVLQPNSEDTQKPSDGQTAISQAIPDVQNAQQTTDVQAGASDLHTANSQVRHTDSFQVGYSDRQLSDETNSQQ